MSEPITTEDWLDFFPPTTEGIRPGQEEAINDILDKFQNGTTDYLFQGGVGSGKSLDAYTTAQYFNAEHGWRTRIFVPTIALQVQYMKDFAPYGMRLLMSARNYDCPDFDACAEGRGTEEDIGEAPKAELLLRPAEALEQRRPRCRCEDCPYLMARTEFELGAIGVTNTKYGLTCAHYGHPFVDGDLAIFDEAHNLESEICSMFEVSIRCDLCREEPEEGHEVQWLHDVYRPLLIEAIERLSQQLARSTQLAMTSPNLSLERRLKEYKHLEFSIRFITDQADWLVIHSWPRLVFEPVWATKIAPALLAEIAPRRLYMSGTFLNFELQKQLLGLL